MAIRLRTVNGVRVALCAYETDPMPGDVYLDDSDHGALCAKWAQDYAGRTITEEYTEYWSVMDSQKLRDARTDYGKWQGDVANLGVRIDRQEPGATVSCGCNRPCGAVMSGSACRPGLTYLLPAEWPELPDQGEIW